MFRRVVSFCAALLCTICFITSGRTYASGIWTVDGNVDPWADLEELDRIGSGQSDGEADGGVEGEVAPAPESASESEPSPSAEASPAASAQLGGEEEDPVDWFGFSAVTQNGDVVEAGVVDGIESYATVRDFSARFLSDYTFYLKRTNYSASEKAVGPDTFFSSTSSGLPSWSFGVGYSSSYSISHYCSSSQVQVLLSFPELSGQFIDSISLFGTLTSRVGVRWVNEDGFEQSYKSSYYVGSCQLIYYTEDNPDRPVILASFVPSASGVVSFDSSVVNVNQAVTEIGLRFQYSNLPTSEKLDSGKYYGYRWQLSFSPNAQYYVDYETGDPEGGVVSGLLSGLIEWVQAIYETVVGLPGKIGEIITNIGALPGMILDGIKSLFIPSEEDLSQLGDKYNGLFEEKLGFVYQAFSFIVDGFGAVGDALAAGGTYSFEFPGLQFPMNGEMVVVLAPTVISLDNAVMDVLRPVLGTGISIVCVLAFSSLCFDMVLAVMSGASYFDFLKGKGKEGESE